MYSNMVEIAIVTFLFVFCCSYSATLDLPSLRDCTAGAAIPNYTVDPLRDPLLLAQRGTCPSFAAETLILQAE